MIRPRRATKLARGWNKRPVYNFPETIFAGRNISWKQLDHVLSEVEEIREAVLDTSAPYDDIACEIADLTHSLETFWRVLERTRGRSYVQGVFNEVEIKNRRRGYYLEGGEQS